MKKWSSVKRKETNVENYYENPNDETYENPNDDVYENPDLCSQENQSDGDEDNIYETVENG